MKKGIKISIPKPCHENWDAMTPEAKGRFCSSCNKTLVDFTTLSDNTIVSILKNAKNGVCGRFEKTQLNRPILLPLAPKWYDNNFWKYAAASVLMFKLSMPKAHAQGSPMLHQKQDTINPVTKAKDSIKPKSLLGDTIFTEPIDTILKAEEIEPIENIERKNTNEDKKDSLSFRLPLFIENIKDSLQFFTYGDISITKTLGYCVFEDTLKLEKEVIFLDGITKLKLPNINLQVYENGIRKEIITNADGKMFLENINKEATYLFEFNANGYESSSLIIIGADIEEMSSAFKIYLNPLDSIKLQSNLAQNKNEKPELPPPQPKEPIKPNIIDSKILDNPKITIFPNPLPSGGTLKINFTAPTNENYMIAIVDINGKCLQTQKISATKGLQNISVVIAHNITPQMAFVKLMNAKGQWVATEKLIIL